MEKIVVVLNARKPSMPSIDFACAMATLTQSKLTGLFVENLFFEYIPATATDNPSYFKAVKESNTTTLTADTDQSVKMFKDACQQKGIAPQVYIDKGEPIEEVVHESRYADLLIVDPEISFYKEGEQLPSHFIKEILYKSECPVLLSPEKYEGAEEVIFCFDGSASSVFAIKQFTYLFPEFNSQKVILLEVNKTGKEEFDAHQRKTMDLLRAHYKTATYHALKGDVADELFDYFFMQERKIIVMGAYGRNMLSNFFKRSNADVLIRMVDLPLFITHH